MFRLTMPMLLLLAGPAAAAPYSFTPVPCSGPAFVAAGNTVGTTPVVLQPASPAAGVPRWYLYYQVTGGGTVCISYDGSTPTINGANTKCFGATLPAAGEELTPAYGYVPPGQITAVASAASVAVTCFVAPN